MEPNPCILRTRGSLETVRSLIPSRHSTLVGTRTRCATPCATSSRSRIHLELSSRLFSSQKAKAGFR